MKSLFLSSFGASFGPIVERGRSGRPKRPFNSSRRRQAPLSPPSQDVASFFILRSYCYFVYARATAGQGESALLTLVLSGYPTSERTKHPFGHSVSINLWRASGCCCRNGPTWTRDNMMRPPGKSKCASRIEPSKRFCSKRSPDY